MLSLSSCGSSSFVVWTNFGRGFRLRSGDRVWASRESFLRSAGGGGGGGSGCCDFFNFMEEVLEEVEAAVIVVVVVATGIGGVGFSILASRGMIRRGATFKESSTSSCSGVVAGVDLLDALAQLSADSEGALVGSSLLR